MKVINFEDIKVGDEVIIADDFDKELVGSTAIVAGKELSTKFVLIKIPNKSRYVGTRWKLCSNLLRKD